VHPESESGLEQDLRSQCPALLGERRMVGMVMSKDWSELGECGMY
jgi:hypothetical protein